jgi:putative protease
MAKKAKKKVKVRARKPKKAAKKKVIRKTKKTAARKKASIPPSPTAGLETIGEITHYFPHVNAGVIKLQKPLSLGETIYIKGHTTDFKQKVESLQIERAPVQTGKPQDEVGILVKKRVRAGDLVYRI